MLLIRCPYCEEDRPELEFRNAGEAHIARSANMAAISDDEFEKFFFIRTNPKGVIFERWRHVHGCGRFFNGARDTVTDRFLTVYKAGEPKPDLSTLASSAPAAYANRPPDQLNAKKTAAKRTATKKKGEA
ncbi:MAG: sarcosine oxidase subunit delta [Hyphomicrobiales bacterium]|nr:sarcosine oxidase subunit delta [Hyphomicrobiales bacterium]